MMAKSEPSTWRILPTNDGHFQWAVTSGDSGSGSERLPKTLAPKEDHKSRSLLPSMKDLLLQVEQSTSLSNRSYFIDQHRATPPKLGGVRRDHGGDGAMFSTGSGRTLSVQQSSIQKARSLLEGENVADKASCASVCFPMFRTGLGKSVQVRQSSIKKASALLEVTNDKEGNPVCKDALTDHSLHEVWDTGSTCPPLKFQTAGGRSISISADALKRVRTLLNDSGSEALEGEAKANAPTYSTSGNEKIYNKASCNIKRVSLDSLHEGSFMNRTVLEIPSSENQLCSPLIAPITSRALSNQIESKHDHHLSNNGSCSKPPNEDLPITHRKVPCSRMFRGSRSAGGALVDISNYTGSSFTNKSWFNGEQKRPGKGSSSSSFKRPRTSRFTAPLNCSSSLAATVLPSNSVNCCCRTRVSSRFPFQLRRMKLKEFFGVPPGRCSMFDKIPDRVRYMTADNAEKYRFHDTCSSIDFGPEAFQEMLLQSGALLVDTSEKWVANHYKWIVWKLASLERCYPSEAICKLLTVSNVLEELKYRYEREVNYGHRSALKKILDGDVSPSSMMILCISAIRYSDPRTVEVHGSSDLHEDGKKLIGVDNNHAVKIELTDGWYSLDATLDAYLSKQLLAGKLFVGQKLRVCGASLCGWVEPISPLEASNMISLVLHINGTYRAHWADSLGFCKDLGAPVAFRCIKGGGGKVPRTLVGVTRLYPILYKERLPDGGSIVRSESMEKKILQFNSRRRSDIAEDIISELEDVPVNVNDSEEGAKILRILESSAEPEVLMAGMSLQQLASFSCYQEKQEALRQANLHKKIEKALEEAGLGSRDVTPFMRVRVMGLINIESSSRKGRPREGLITIWNPTEKQKLDLVEGQIYSVSWLVPFSGSSDFLYLQSRGPTSEWICLPTTESKKFESFFIPRKSVLLSNLGEAPLASEFDMAAVVVHVGEVYISGSQRKQWIFVADGSGCICNSLDEDKHESLLAISFCSPINDSLAPINQCLSGNTVGFCNLIKRSRDRNNHLWVAEATENSTYSICYNISCGSHLKEAANSALKWAKTSSLALKKLEERVLCITGAHQI